MVEQDRAAHDGSARVEGLKSQAASDSTVSLYDGLTPERQASSVCSFSMKSVSAPPLRATKHCVSIRVKMRMAMSFQCPERSMERPLWVSRMGGWSAAHLIATMRTSKRIYTVDAEGALANFNPLLFDHLDHRTVSVLDGNMISPNWTSSRCRTPPSAGRPVRCRAGWLSSSSTAIRGKASGRI